MGPLGWQVMGLSKRVPGLSVCCGPFFGVQPKRQLVPKQCHLGVHPRVARGTEKITEWAGERQSKQAGPAARKAASPRYRPESGKQGGRGVRIPGSVITHSPSREGQPECPSTDEGTNACGPATQQNIDNMEKRRGSRTRAAHGAPCKRPSERRRLNTRGHASYGSIYVKRPEKANPQGQDPCGAESGRPTGTRPPRGGGCLGPDGGGDCTPW